MVEQSGEPLLLSFPCYFSHTVQPLGHALPVLCRVHVRLSGRTVARNGLRMMPTFPLSPLSFRTAGRLAFQVAPSLISLRLSQHPAYPAQYVGLRLPFVHSAAPLCAPLCVGTMDSVMHRHSRSWLLYPRGLRSGPGSIVPAHQRLIDLIRPTRRHIPISPLGGLYGMPSLCWCA